MISIIKIPLLKDNYSYALLNKKEIIIIDPAESTTILEYIYENNLFLKAILITHHHHDHTAGIKGILEKFQTSIYSPNKEIKFTTNIVKGGDLLDLGFIKVKTISTPGHTMDHVVYYIKEINVLFSGDSLFRLGCGRIFEGNYKNMFTSLQKIFSLKSETSVYCGHEYTNNNLKFLMSVFPKNKYLLSEQVKIELELKETGSSIPFNLGNEKHINPYLSPNSAYYKEFKKENKLSDFEFFSKLRDLKNNF